LNRQDAKNARPGEVFTAEDAEGAERIEHRIAE